MLPSGLRTHRVQTSRAQVSLYNHQTRLIASVPVQRHPAARLLRPISSCTAPGPVYCPATALASVASAYTENMVSTKTDNHERSVSGQPTCMLHIQQQPKDDQEPLCRVVVCGAGVIGASVAYYLSQLGVPSILVERAEPACASSGLLSKPVVCSALHVMDCSHRYYHSSCR